MSRVPGRGHPLLRSLFARYAPQPTERAAHAAGARKMTRRDVRDGIESLRHSRINFAQHRAQFVAQFADFLITVLRIFLERSIENYLQAWRHRMRPRPIQRRWLFLQHSRAPN